jgi:hypothetical protein
MLLRFSALAMAGLVLFGVAACTSSRNYSMTRPDKDYDLAAMALTEQEMPGGLKPAVLNQHDYSNADWVATLRTAQIIDPSGDATKQTKQLDDEGRISNWVSVYSAASLGRIIGVTTVSTLYKTAGQADTAMAKDLCGLPLDTTQQTAPLAVPRMADATSGFQTVANGGLVNSTLCIRTGRIIHAIQETNVPGTEDFAALIQMGEDMVTRVNGVLDGKIKGTAVPTAPPSATPSATGTPSPSATSSTTPAPSTTTAPSASATAGG